MRTATILSFVLLLAPAFAQLDTATISGTITDASGAIVPGAQVMVVNTETNFESLTTTNSDGFFRIPSLRPGPYRVTVKAAGFKTSIRGGIDLRVGDNLAV